MPANPCEKSTTPPKVLSSTVDIVYDQLLVTGVPRSFLNCTLAGLARAILTVPVHPFYMVKRCRNMPGSEGLSGLSIAGQRIKEGRITSLFTGLSTAATNRGLREFPKFFMTTEGGSQINNAIDPEINRKFPYLKHALTAIPATLCDITVSPFDRVSAYKVTMQNATKEVKPALSIFKEMKIRQWVNGWRPYSAHQFLNYTAFLIGHDQIKSELTKHGFNTNGSSVAMAVGDFAVAAVTTPLTNWLDVVRTQQMAYNPISQKGIIAATRHIYSQPNGFRALNAGCIQRIIASGIGQMTRGGVMDYVSQVKSRHEKSGNGLG